MVFRIFIWELFPEWMFPLLTGFSIFCLANPKSPAFSRVFGGSNGNEGLGLLSICFDWQVSVPCKFWFLVIQCYLQYIAGTVNPMAIPLKAQVCFGSTNRKELAETRSGVQLNWLHTLHVS
jgi:hypothetical protein